MNCKKCNKELILMSEKYYNLEFGDLQLERTYHCLSCVRYVKQCTTFTKYKTETIEYTSVDLFYKGEKECTTD